MEEGHIAPPGQSAAPKAPGGYRHRRLYLAEPRQQAPRQPFRRSLLVLGLLVTLAPALVISGPSEAQHPSLAVVPEVAPTDFDTLSMRVEATPPVSVPVVVGVPKRVRRGLTDVPRRAAHASDPPLLWTAAPPIGSEASETIVHEAPAPRGPHPAAGGEAIRVIGVGEASYYGQAFAGNATASGEPFDPAELTAAHRSLPFGTHVRVTNMRNGKSVVVRINDRGPFVRHRIIDLSRAAAQVIGMIRRGSTRVRLQRVE